MFCTKCGTQLPDNVKFCPKCGAPTGVATTQATKPSAPKPPKSETHRKRKAPAVIALVVVVSLIIGLVGFWKPGFFINNDGKTNTTDKDTDKNTGKNDKNNNKNSKDNNGYSAGLTLKKSDIDKIEPIKKAVSPDEPLVELDNVTIDMGFMEEEHTLEVRDLGKLRDESLGADVYGFDYRLDDGTVQPDDIVTITMPYDKSIDNPREVLTARWYNEDTGKWETVPAYFDEDAKTVTFYTEHFSTHCLFDTSGTDSAFWGAIKDYEAGSTAGGTTQLNFTYDEYKNNKNSNAVSWHISQNPNSNLGDLNAYLYNKADILAGKGALCRVYFDANRFDEIAKKYSADFNVVKQLTKEEKDWQADEKLAGKTASLVGIAGDFLNGFGIVGKIAGKLSDDTDKKLTIAGAVLTGIKFAATWYESGDFVEAFRQNRIDLLTTSMDVYATFMATGTTAVYVGAAAAVIWGAWTAYNYMYPSERDQLLALRKGEYQNATQRAYMEFTLNLVGYSRNSDKKSQSRGVSNYFTMEEHPKAYEAYANLYKAYIDKPDDFKPFSEKDKSGLSNWKDYLVRCTYQAKDLKELSDAIDEALERVAGRFWLFKDKSIREQYALDIGCDLFAYKEPTEEEKARLIQDCKRVLAMINSDNIDEIINKYEQKAKSEALKSIDELTEEFNKVTTFNFYVEETDKKGEKKLVPLNESKFKDYIVAFCPSETIAPRNAEYGIVDDWIFRARDNKFSCTLYNWLKSADGPDSLKTTVRLFKDEDALKNNISEDFAEFVYDYPNVDIVFGREAEYKWVLVKTIPAKFPEDVEESYGGKSYVKYFKRAVRGKYNDFTVETISDGYHTAYGSSHYEYDVTNHTKFTEPKSSYNAGDKFESTVTMDLSGTYTGDTSKPVISEMYFFIELYEWMAEREEINYNKEPAQVGYGKLSDKGEYEYNQIFVDWDNKQASQTFTAIMPEGTEGDYISFRFVFGSGNLYINNIYVYQWKLSK